RLRNKRLSIWRQLQDSWRLRVRIPLESAPIRLLPGRWKLFQEAFNRRSSKTRSEILTALATPSPKKFQNTSLLNDSNILRNYTPNFLKQSLNYLKFRA